MWRIRFVQNAWPSVLTNDLSSNYICLNFDDFFMIRNDSDFFNDLEMILNVKNEITNDIFR